MRLEISQPLPYYAAETVLVVSREELDDMIDSAETAEQFTDAINSAATDLGFDLDRNSKLCRHGKKSINVWLDSVTQKDTTRLAVRLMAEKTKPNDQPYLRNKGSWSVVVESHQTIA